MRQLTIRWVGLVFSTMSGLFVTLFLTRVVHDMGQTMLDTMTNKFLVTGVTLTSTDFLMPVGVGVVLMVTFVVGSADLCERSKRVCS